MVETAGDEFWKFSLAFYRRGGVAEACLALQDRHGLDVNLVLYACWVGLSGRGRLGKRDLAEAERATAPWRRDVTEKLRTRRRMLKSAEAALYAEAQQQELAAEEVAQHGLARLAPALEAASRDAMIADARANLWLYVAGEAARELAAPILAALNA